MDDKIRNDSLKSSDRLKQEVCKEHTVMVKKWRKRTYCGY